MNDLRFPTQSPCCTPALDQPSQFAEIPSLEGIASSLRRLSDDLCTSTVQHSHEVRNLRCENEQLLCLLRAAKSPAVFEELQAAKAPVVFDEYGNIPGETAIFCDVMNVAPLMLPSMLRTSAQQPFNFEDQDQSRMAPGIDHPFLPLPECFANCAEDRSRPPAKTADSYIVCPPPADTPLHCISNGSENKQVSFGLELVVPHKISICDGSVIAMEKNVHEENGKSQSPRVSSVSERLLTNFGDGSLLPRFEVCAELENADHDRHANMFITQEGSRNSTSHTLAHLKTAPAPAEKRKTCAFRPTSPFRLVWECLGIFVLGWDMVMIPMQAFSMGASPFLTFMGWATLGYWTFDIFGSFCVGYYTNDGKLVMQLSMIVKNYIKTWFGIDCFIVSIDWLTLYTRFATTGRFSIQDDESAAGGAQSNLAVMRAGKALRALRLLRLLRALKVARSNFFLMVQEKLVSESLFVMSNLLTNIMVLIFIAHFCACSFFWVGSQRYEGYDSWVHVYKVKPKGWLWCYLTSVHWALAQFANGEILIEPQNIPERLMCITVLLASLVIFSAFVAIVGNTVQQLIQKGAKQRQDQWFLRQYLRQQGVSWDLKLRIMRYISVIMQSSKSRLSTKDIDCISKLSAPLQLELKTEFFIKYLTEHSFFACLWKQNAMLMRDFCKSSVESVLLSKGDMLFGVNEEAESMFFVDAGVLQYAHHTVPSEKLDCKSWFCESVLWTERWITCGSMFADSDCELIALSGPSFRQVLSRRHGHDMTFPQRYAKAWVNTLNTSIHDRGITALTDLQMFILEADEVRDLMSTFQPAGSSSLFFKAQHS